MGAGGGLIAGLFNAGSGVFSSYSGASQDASSGQKPMPVANPSYIPTFHNSMLNVQHPEQTLILIFLIVALLLILRKLASYLFRRKRVKVVKKFE